MVTAAEAPSWLIFSSSFIRTFPGDLFPRQSISSPYFFRENFLPRCRTLHFVEFYEVPFSCNESFRHKCEIKNSQNNYNTRTHDLCDQAVNHILDWRLWWIDFAVALHQICSFALTRLVEAALSVAPLTTGSAGILMSPSRFSSRCVLCMSVWPRRLVLSLSENITHHFCLQIDSKLLKREGKLTSASVYKE